MICPLNDVIEYFLLKSVGDIKPEKFVINFFDYLESADVIESYNIRKVPSGNREVKSIFHITVNLYKDTREFPFFSTKIFYLKYIVTYYLEQYKGNTTGVECWSSIKNPHEDIFTHEPLIKNEAELDRLYKAFNPSPKASPEHLINIFNDSIKILKSELDKVEGYLQTYNKSVIKCCGCWVSMQDIWTDALLYAVGRHQFTIEDVRSDDYYFMIIGTVKLLNINLARIQLSYDSDEEKLYYKYSIEKIDWEKVKEIN